MDHRTQILLIDHQPIVRFGIRKLLEKDPDLEVAWECSSCHEALDLIKSISPNLIISEALFPMRECVLTFLKEIQASHPTLPLLVFSGQSEDLIAERVLNTGGAGFVHKSACPTELLTAIRTALQGEVYMSAHMASRALRRYSHGGSHPEEPNPVDRLSNRELEIFNLIGVGSSIREIAKELNISIKTVETHRSHIKEKLILPKDQGLVSFASQWFASGTVFKAS
ncbi:MAG: response regulator transcription factor [Verrucomicrobia bacterium]|nr:response regulator transcription factor [Verrucomicrobiota bacterium]MDA1005310.1 response regulator transcription factor [Verrucomicrobiota bacterium]